MLNIFCKTDPMSGKDLFSAADLPFVKHDGKETSVTVYFESEKSRLAYLDMPVEHPTSEHSVNLDNPTDDY